MRILVLAALAATLAVPAAAQSTRAVPTRTGNAADGSTICVRSTHSAGCRAYQERLLQSVGRSAARSERDISVNDLGRRQLNALVASIS